MRRGREEARGREYMMRGSGAGGLASRAMGSAVHMGKQGMDNSDRRLWNGQLPSHVCMYVCMVITYSRVWINRVRLPILLVVS